MNSIKKGELSPMIPSLERKLGAYGVTLANQMIALTELFCPGQRILESTFSLLTHYLPE
jgi:hypothetical protein